VAYNCFFFLFLWTAWRVSWMFPAWREDETRGYDAIASFALSSCWLAAGSW
jgi:hypothetical protein